MANMIRLQSQKDLAKKTGPTTAGTATGATPVLKQLMLRSAVAALLLLLGCGLAEAAITLVASAHTSAGSPDANTFTTGSIDTTGANFLVLVLASYTVVTEPVISDSKGNTWTQLTESTTTASCATRIYYAANATVGSSHTFTATENGAAATIAVAAFAGVKASSPADQETGVGDDTEGLARSTGSITPTENNELIVSGICFDATNTMAISESMTITNQTNFSVGAHFGGALAYKIQTTATAISPEWSWGGNAKSAVRIASFKAAAATGGVMRRRVLVF